MQIGKSEGPFYKESCHFCFKTDFDGLYLSTLTNRSYCLDHINLHLDQYPNDKFYINIIKVNKPEVPKPKIIKLEINYSKDSDLFEVSYNLVEFVDNKFNLINPNDESIEIINKIKNSNSISKIEELKSWQLEIKPCEHTLNYTPINCPIDLNNLKCSNCDLNENLWLCLNCGNVGCGRSQFGGVPGNTHALEHSDETGHFIAIKLGSLTKEIQDIYCYKCNEEVSIANILEILLNYFNINLNEFKQSEKGLLELQIEQNLEWDFNLKNSKGEDLKKLFGPGLTGLKNLGNSCYLNSCFQLLFSIKEYQDKFFTKLIKEDNDLSFEFIKLANGLLSGKFSKPSDNDGYQSGIQPSSMKYKISEDNEEFRSMKQQDSMEFLSFVLNKIDKIDSNLNDIFRFISVEKFKFDNNLIKLKNQIVESISLPIKIEVEKAEDNLKIYKRQSFLNELSNYLKPEEIELNNKIIKKSNYFKSFPKYLIISTQRIVLEGWNPIKVDVPLEIPQEFDLKNLQPELIESNETVMPDDDEEEFVPNESLLEQLVTMGFPVQRSKRALFENDNNSNIDEVMDWLFQRMEDDSLDEEIVFKKKKQAQVDQEKINALGDMGFNSKLSTKALVLNNHNVNEAIEWLFSNPDDDGELPPSKEDDFAKFENEINSSKYKLKGIICHKGTQVTSGHYVVFIKYGDTWVLFNDEKVVDVTNDEKSWSEIEKNGYVYLWERA